MCNTYILFLNGNTIFFFTYSDRLFFLKFFVYKYIYIFPEKYHPPHNYVLRILQGLNQEGRFPDRQNNQQRRRP